MALIWTWKRWVQRKSFFDAGQHSAWIHYQSMFYESNRTLNSHSFSLSVSKSQHWNSLTVHCNKNTRTQTTGSSLLCYILGGHLFFLSEQAHDVRINYITFPFWRSSHNNAFRLLDYVPRFCVKIFLVCDFSSINSSCIRDTMDIIRNYRRNRSFSFSSKYPYLGIKKKAFQQDAYHLLADRTCFSSH